MTTPLIACRRVAAVKLQRLARSSRQTQYLLQSALRLLRRETLQRRAITRPTAPLDGRTLWLNYSRDISPSGERLIRLPAVQMSAEHCVDARWPSRCDGSERYAVASSAPGWLPQRKSIKYLPACA